ncbi:MAG: D-glycero-beta-D-manno-heptose 1,7-bisphosphate 7-phosphatase [Acidobacteriota bacterium]
MSDSRQRQIQNPKSKIQNRESAIPSALFIDRDGTINEDSGYLATPDELIIYPWVAQAVRLINEAGLMAIVVTNQSGIARGLYTEDQLRAIHDRMIGELQREAARIDAVYYCPHHPDYGGKRYRRECECRKPQPGMLHAAAREHNIDLARSWVIGDKASDINLAANTGARGVLVLTGYGSETLAHRERWPCEPEMVADNLLHAVRLILDAR